jgi:hypothetical protein
VCVFATVALPIAGCGDGSTAAGGAGGTGGEGGVGGSGGRYAQENLWLCRPGIANDQCALADLSTTEIRADGTSVISDGPTMNPDASFDCFVVYPTVNNSMEAGNTADPSPTDGTILEALYRNGARFRGTCRMYAPLYRQMTLGTYFEFPGAWRESPPFQMAYADILEAFDYYMRNHNQGRDLVLIGHSQGSHVLERLMGERFETDEALLGQLISALLIGGDVEVPEGELVGGTFSTIPLCSSGNETGCIVAFVSLADPNTNVSEVTAAKEVVPSGNLPACVNPASFSDTTATLGALLLSRTSFGEIFPSGLTTEWVSYPNVYSAKCGSRRMLIGLADEDAAPFTPLEFQAANREAGGWELHQADFPLTTADLIRILETQAATRKRKHASAR